MLASLTFFFDAISPHYLVTKFLKDFVMLIVSPFVFLIFGMINTENKKIGHKLNKHQLIYKGRTHIYVRKV